MPVLALHGYPDSAELWRYQMGPLAAAGFQVIAPDLRGFGESWKPQDVESYAPLKLLADVVGIMQHFGVRRANLVGHDFGAFLAWTLAAFIPRRVHRLVTISVAHPAVWSYPTLEQRHRFWYSLLFIHPAAEQILRQRNWELLREMLGAERDGERFLRDLQRPGALTAAMNWYRANCQPTYDLNGNRAVPPVAAPTMALIGGRDTGFTEEAMRDSERYVTGEWKFELVEEAGHWVPIDVPDRVTDLLLGWFGTSGKPVATASMAEAADL
ncbi:MAG TPA: alpha/beta hydrolase [Streptosporangiaceae bacterium]|nr:alpha/beta hydrolase [Streptosporangiaceae bacterium]